ncbi:MFS transporter [Amycolatopsis sp. AA4]|uniref:MFS transporter n=1 Tax=Actinomycetes TaxID=1760 RepID=UPI0001B545A8|nr:MULTISPECIES: MFS transporter [Actinomycetes]ATY12998.1 MFS transporter [Amycolatopsis sp. AA4]
MTAGVAPAARGRSALDEPVLPVGRKWTATWSFAYLGLFLANYGAQQIVLPRQANLIAAGEETAVAAQSWANASAAVVTVIVSILVGALSDRTLHRTGRRQVWIVYGGLLAAVAFVFQGFQHTVVGVVIAWGVFTAGMSAVVVALSAALPDDVPTSQRGRVSGYLAVGTAVGPLIGVAVVTFLLTGVLDAYVGLALLLLLCVLPFGLRVRGTPLRRAERPPLALRAIATGIFTPLRSADFAWVCGQRALINLSNALAQVFLYQYLKDEVHVDPDLGTLLLMVCYTAGIVVIAVPVGRHSDRTGKRKRVVVWSSAAQGAAALILAFVPTFPAAIAGASLLGFGYGAYLSVDQAVVTQVLPHAEDRGKDLGILQLSSALPMIVAAAVGGVLVASLGGFPALFVASAATGLAAAVCVLPIRSVA